MASFSEMTIGLSISLGNFIMASKISSSLLDLSARFNSLNSGSPFLNKSKAS